ncbi:hypothetical protein AB0J43_33950 [Nonomuraea fuscirosea]
MLITVAIDADPTRAQRTHFLHALSTTACAVLNLQPGQIRLTVTEIDAQARARATRERAVLLASWTGC